MCTRPKMLMKCKPFIDITKCPYFHHFCKIEMTRKSDAYRKEYARKRDCAGRIRALFNIG